MWILELLARTAISFFVLFIMMRLIGRKEIGQLTFFNFATAITIGSIAASLVTDNQLKIHHGILAIVFWALLTILFEIIDIKSINLRKLITGEPVILIKNGTIDRKAMRKCRFDLNTLSAMMRQNNVNSFAEVEYAIFEASGKLPTIKKEEYQPASKGDINKPIGQKVYPLPLIVVSDGKLLNKNLEKLHMSENDLLKKLSDAGLRSVKDVFLAQAQTDGSLYLVEKE